MKDIAILVSFLTAASPNSVGSEPVPIIQQQESYNYYLCDLLDIDNDLIQIGWRKYSNKDYSGAEETFKSLINSSDRLLQLLGYDALAQYNKLLEQYNDTFQQYKIALDIVMTIDKPESMDKKTFHNLKTYFQRKYMLWYGITRVNIDTLNE